MKQLPLCSEGQSPALVCTVADLTRVTDMGQNLCPWQPWLLPGSSPSASPCPGANTRAVPCPRMPAASTSHLCCQHGGGERHVQFQFVPVGSVLPSQVLVCLCRLWLVSALPASYPAFPCQPYWPTTRMQRQKPPKFFTFPTVIYSALSTINPYPMSLQATQISWSNPNWYLGPSILVHMISYRSKIPYNLRPRW